MIVLGVDPGTMVTGYGVVDCRLGAAPRHIAHGTVRTRAKDPLWQRLQLIHKRIAEVVDEHTPDVLSLERVFVGKNIQSALKLGHTRGAVIVACARDGLDIHEYTAGQIKSAVTGHGRAEKHQVAEMVRIILSLTKAAPSDASDALAAALCHGHRGLSPVALLGGAR